MAKVIINSGGRMNFVQDTKEESLRNLSTSQKEFIEGYKLYNEHRLQYYWKYRKHYFYISAAILIIGILVFLLKFKN